MTDKAIEALTEFFRRTFTGETPPIGHIEVVQGEHIFYDLRGRDQNDRSTILFRSFDQSELEEFARQFSYRHHANEVINIYLQAVAGEAVGKQFRWRLTEADEWSLWSSDSADYPRITQVIIEERPVFAAPQAPQPRVKPLVWVGYETDSPMGHYRAQRLDDKWELLKNGYFMLPKVHGAVTAFNTIEEAKAAAQADHEYCILSEIESEPSAPAIPAGWKLVPIEPTMEMIKAGKPNTQGDYSLPHSLYKAMLAAAPSPEASNV